MSTRIRNFPLSQKLMISPCLFASFLVLIGAMSHMEASKTALTVVLLVAFSVSLSISLIVARSVKGALENMLRAIKELSKGDLTLRIEETSEDEIGRMSRGFNGINENLQRIMVHVKEDSEHISSAAVKMQTSIEQVTVGIKELAAQTTSVATASEEMVATCTQIAGSCNSVVSSSKKADHAAEQGGAAVTEAAQVMAEISDRVKTCAVNIRALSDKSDKIGSVIQFVNDIADQTNLLALNAAIEAARAGEHGRSFAVVADEVRKLAEHTANAIKEIEGTIADMQVETKAVVDLMEASVGEVDLGTRTIGRAGQVLKDIIGQINAVNQQIGQIAVATEQEKATTTEISGNILRVSSVMERISTEMQESSLAVLKLSGVTEGLEGMLKQFRI